MLKEYCLQSLLHHSLYFCPKDIKLKRKTFSHKHNAEVFFDRCPQYLNQLINSLVKFAILYFIVISLNLVFSLIFCLYFDKTVKNGRSPVFVCTIYFYSILQEFTKYFRRCVKIGGIRHQMMKSISIVKILYICISAIIF